MLCAAPLPSWRYGLNYNQYWYCWAQWAEGALINNVEKDNFLLSVLLSVDLMCNITIQPLVATQVRVGMLLFAACLRLPTQGFDIQDRRNWCLFPLPLHIRDPTANFPIPLFASNSNAIRVP